MQLTIMGCGDAFSSGGRFHSCYLLDTSAGRLMIECGANAPLALKRAGIALSSIDAIVISHCHGDHFGGLPFLFLDKIFVELGSAPLEIFGPPGIQARTAALLEAVYPGIAALPRKFEIIYSELMPSEERDWRGLSLAAYEVEHFSGSPSLALSIAGDARRLSFSGDAGWCKGVIEAGRGADLYLIECTTFRPQTQMHLDYLTLATKFSEIGAKRYLLTHMGEDMLSSINAVDAENCILATDGLSVTI